MSTYWQAMRARRQVDGLVGPRGNDPSPDSTGNGLLYLSLAHICAVLNRYPPNAGEFGAIVRSCYVAGRPGILHRSPTKMDDQNGWDDYIGMAAAARIVGDCHLAWVTLNAGNVRRFGLFKWFFKNNKPDTHKLFDQETWQAWFGRNPSAVAHLQFSSGVWPHALRSVWQAIDLTITALRLGKNHDSALLGYLMVLVWDRHWARPWYIEMAVKLFKKRLKFKYGSFRGVLVHRLDADHPIVTHWPETV
jgi:hypothetical protein